MQTLQECYDDKDACAERATLTGMGLPEDFVRWYQLKREELGIRSPTAIQRFFMNLVVGLLVVVLMMFLFTQLLNYFNLLWRGVTGGLFDKAELFKLAAVTGLIAGILAYSFYYAWQLEKKEYDFIRDVLNLEGFQNGNPKLFSSSGPETNLANLQFVATKHAGFIGPKEVGGSFTVEPAILASLRLGIRSYVLQIDYLEATKKGFAAPGDPTLVVRDARGNLLSKNDAKIADVAKLLNTYAFNEEVRSADQPLVLYLHFLRAPSLVRKPEEYVSYMNKVAVGLEPLFARNISNTPEGAAFARQQAEPQLLKTSLKTFEQKVVIVSNADTSIYRNLERLGQKAMEPVSDLDYLTHLRVFAETAADRVGSVMEVAPVGGKRPVTAIFVKAGRILTFKDAQLEDFAKQGRERFVIAMPTGLQNPTKPELRKLLDLAAVNMIPLGLYGEEIPALRAKLSAWGEEPFLRLKPAVLQVTPPAGAGAAPAAGQLSAAA